VEDEGEMGCSSETMIGRDSGCIGSRFGRVGRRSVSSETDSLRLNPAGGGFLSGILMCLVSKRQEGVKPGTAENSKINTRRVQFQATIL